jgi:hypothetical protein
MKKLFPFLTVLFVSVHTNAQDDTLVGAVDGQLIKISHTNAGISSYQVVTSLPGGNVLARLSWSPFNQYFYTLDFNGTAFADGLVIISSAGNYSVKGAVTVPGYTVYSLEGIALDKETGDLYASASLNGAAPGDYWAETLLKVDTSTLVGTIIGEFSHTGVVYDAEADIISIGDDGYLYYNDTEGGGSPWIRMYKQDIAMSGAPVLIYEDVSGGNVGDITVKDGFLYFTVNRILRKIDLSDNTHSVVGTMFTSADFSGLQMNAIDWISPGDLSIEKMPGITLELFPNPSAGMFTVKTGSVVIDRVDVIDITGNIVKTIPVNATSAELNLSDLADGTYQLKVSHNSGFIIQQVILAR